ncbi:WD40 repeat-like protein [Cubamyces sp. BRFM 1775]|nr:WD40 repeat-like protein [Cubamyces sp. BRFM 1775]
MPNFLVSAYLHVGTLVGHSDTINCLAYSPNGTYLASGGDDFVLIIWNALQGRLLYRLVFGSAVDAVIWHPVHPDTVIVGCADGTLQQVRNFSMQSEQHDIHLGARNTVHCLTYEATSGRLAIGMGEEVHVTRERMPNQYVGDTVLPPPPESPDMDKLPDSERRLRPVALQFHDEGAALIVAYLAHGISCWDTSTTEQRWHIPMPSAKPNMSVLCSLISSLFYLTLHSSGGAAISPDGRNIAVYNLVDGLDIYGLVAQKRPKAKLTCKLESSMQTRHRLQVAYIHRGRGIVCGTTDGRICIWESATGELNQQLPHDGDVIQAVAATIHNRMSYIAAGSTERGQKTYIKLWRAKISESCL